MSKRKTLHIAYCVAALLWAATFVSCKNDEAEIDRLLENKKSMPTTIENYTMVRVDSGRVIMRLSAGKVVIEESPEDPSVTDKKGSGGISIISYKKGTDEEEVKLTAMKAVEYGVSGLSEAIGNVIVSTSTGDSIITERLVWDREQHIFYTDMFARIVKDGDVMLPRRGFRADENFAWYEMFNSSGEISIEDSLSSSSSSSSSGGGFSFPGSQSRRGGSSTSETWGAGYTSPFPAERDDSRPPRFEGKEEVVEDDGIPWQEEILREKREREARNNNQK
ncbi:MAG: LPS export ABC transporter periplasmic protein LptC [Flavobacteriales bacterium]|nr:LPS export ABC transporter periplasmic protein LptC [Flavobacteriales bacterium]